MKKILLMIGIMVMSFGLIRCDQSKKSVDSQEQVIEKKSPSAPIDPDLKAGKKVYDIYCLMCHGKKGDKELTGMYNLKTSRLNLEEIIEVTISGRTSMMSYENVLNEEDLLLVSKYTLNLQK